MKKAILSATVLFVCSICCVGGEVSLFSLTNEWGKGSTLDFRKKVFQIVPVVLRRGGDDEMVRWYQDVVSYPDLVDAWGTTSWMHEKVETLLRYSLRPPVSASTNCWLATAGLLNQYHKMVQKAESNANVRADLSLIKTDPKRFNEIFYSRKPLIKKAWNLKCVEQTLARVVTNEFPKRVLPLLPESERNTMMSEVLKRAGLAKVEKECDSEMSGRRSIRYVKIGAILFLTLVGCGMVRRYKRR